MMSALLKYFLFLILLTYACGHRETPVTESVKGVEREAPMPEPMAVSEYFLDSATLEQFIKEHELPETRSKQLRTFYRNRDYEFAWFTDSGLAQQARSFWNLHNSYVNYAQDSSFFNKQLHQKMDALTGDEEDVRLTDKERTALELQLSEHFFDYARYAYTGKIDPSELNWHIPRKKVNAVALLDSLIKRNGQQLDNWEPVNEQYKLVRKKLLKLYEIEKQEGWPVIEAADKVYRVGDSSLAVQQLKERLRMAGDYGVDEHSLRFTPDLETAVRRAQKRFGLKQDGAAGPQTLRVLNVPVEKRIEQLLVNMERMRWMPLQKAGKQLVANIPEFRLHVYEGSKEVLSMNVVVGKAAHETVIFNDQLKYVVFSPYWNVPRSIVRNEILPAMQQDPNYLEEHRMEQRGTSGGLPVIRQKPGADNALGRVKFLFPNSYNIYFHDTPAKSLFERQNRAFSHGCIRLEQPKQLAEYLLQNKKGWTNAKISNAMHAGNEQWVTLPDPVPVMIAYFTAWVDKEGLLNFRQDVYGHDRELANRLFVH